MSASTVVAPDPNRTFQMRAAPNEKLRSSAVTEVIHSVLVELLSDYTCDSDTADKMVNKLREVIRERLHELNVARYKFVVNVRCARRAAGWRY